MKQPTTTNGALVAVTETRILEWVNLGYALWWTLLLWLPDHLFATASSFSALAAHAPEKLWGCFTASCAALILLGLLRPRPVVRVLGLAAAAGLWLFVAALLAQGVPLAHLFALGLPESTGVGVYSCIAMGNLVGAVLLSSYMMADILFWAAKRHHAKKEARK